MKIYGMEKEQFVRLNVKLFEERLQTGYRKIEDVMRKNDLEYPIEFEFWALAVMGQIVEKIELGILKDRVQLCEHLDAFIAASVQSPLDGITWLVPYWPENY